MGVELPTPKLQAPGSASDPTGETNTGARDGTANRRITKGGRKVRRESERLIVPRQRGNPPHGDPAKGRGRQARAPFAGNTRETLSSTRVCTRHQRIAELEPAGLAPVAGA